MSIQILFFLYWCGRKCQVKNLAQHQDVKLEEEARLAF